jgi:fumarate hydratase class II
MPGKVNPVVPEAVAMVCFQVLGHDVALGTAAGRAGFQLHLAWPLLAWNLHQSLGCLAEAMRTLADRSLAGFTVNRERLTAQSERNPILATALAPTIGYERAAAIAARAYAEGRPVREIAAEETELDAATLDRLLDPRALTDPR